MSNIEYQRHRHEEWKQFLASLTPEQIELQEKAAEMDRLEQKADDKQEQARLRAEHHAVMDKLILLTFPPNGMTERLSRKEVITRDAEDERPERAREVQEGGSAHP